MFIPQQLINIKRQLSRYEKRNQRLTVTVERISCLNMYVALQRDTRKCTVLAHYFSGICAFRLRIDEDLVVVILLSLQSVATHKAFVVLEYNPRCPRVYTTNIQF